MYDTLQLYSGYMKPSDLESLVSIEENFQLLNYDKHVDTINDSLSYKEDGDDSQVANFLIASYYGQAVAICQTLGVVLRDEGDHPFKPVVDVLSALVKIDQADVLDIIETALDQDTDIEVQFSHIVSGLSEDEEPLPPTYYLGFIDYVEPKMFLKLREKSSDVEDHVEINNYIANIKDRLKGLYSLEEHTVVLMHLKAVTALPTYIDTVYAGLREVLLEQDVEKIAKDVVGLACASSITLSDFRRNYNTLLDDVVDHVNVAQLERYLSNFVKHIEASYETS